MKNEEHEEPKDEKLDRQPVDRSCELTEAQRKFARLVGRLIAQAWIEEQQAACDQRSSQD